MYVPERGDVVWLTFTPQVGREQAGRRPALILSPQTYNSKVGLALGCPITNLAKGYPFEVPIPDGQPVTGVILSDHIRSLDWRGRQADFITRLDPLTLAEVIARVEALLND